MDSFTQIALGATIGEAGWRKKLGGRATIWGGFCGLIPDLDMVFAAVDPWADLVYHRSWTHSLLVIPFLAIPVGWLGHRFGKRKGTMGQWVHLSFWALVTHPLLDLFTFFGTQLFYPVSDHRFAIDGVSIVDLFYSLPLLAVCLLALKKGPPPRWRRRMAGWVLAVTTTYLLVGHLTMRVVRAEALAELRGEGFEPDDIRALPTFFNDQAYRIVARRGEGEFRLGYRSYAAGAGTDWLTVRSVDDPRVDRIWETERGQIFRWFSGGLVVVQERPGEPDVLELIDLRFGGVTYPVGKLFAASATFDGDDAPEVERMPQAIPRNLAEEAAALLDVIQTGDSEAWPHPD
ncbi:MAG: metal-dependent hydrolase [Deltaproteobacteria bacterium]|nr:metal-dependent hydrolase [Deltaproteobacteria bacterium]